MASASTTQIGSLEEYVKVCGGKRVIRKVLIANNGIGAVKEIRSVRKWCYQNILNERAVQFVVMATPEDIKANSEFIRMADQFEEVPGGANNNNYANVRLIVDVAQRTGVDAVWAGWGHASENPKLPAALAKIGITFIGPSAGPMRDLGDKIAATLIAQSAGVNCVPWSGSGITIDYNTEGIPESAFRRSTVTCLEEAREALERIGYPAMIKASEGGGGKGIRKVEKEEDLELAFRMVQSEVQGSPIFIMRLVSNAHHLEVQILGDQYGDAISIYGRDCSVQRRHQKILEEGPAACADPDVFKRMEIGAVNMAKAVAYEGAGTIEYLYADSDYFFLELNPRLQVEHPVTEWISGVNLPAAQLCVAMGIPLARIPEVRQLFGEEPFGSTPIDLYNTPQVPPKGHVIAARVTAENPDDGFKPTSGLIQELTFRNTPNVWGYFSVTSLGSLHDFADSQFGHIFAWGENREEARKKLVLTLREMSIRGDIRTALDYLANLMETPDYVDLKFHTGWLDEILTSGNSPASAIDPMLAVVCGAMCKGFMRSKEREDTFISYLQRGQIPPNDLLVVEDVIELIYQDVKYSVNVSKCGPHTFHIAIGSGSVIVECRQLSDGGLLSVVDGKIQVIYAREEATGLRMMIGAKTCCFTLEYDPSTIRAVSPGSLTRYLVEDGAHQAKGTVFAEMEVMKMFMPLRVPESGIIRFMKTEGATLMAGDVIASLELDDPSSVKRSELFEGDLPPMSAPRSPTYKLHQQLSSIRDQLQAVITGYRCPDLKSTVDLLFSILADPQLPLSEFQFAMSNITGRLPKEVEESIVKFLRNYELGLEAMTTCHFPGQSILEYISRYTRGLEQGYLRKGFETTIEPISALARKFVKGLASHRSSVVLSFLQEFLWVENFFSSRQREDAILELREKHPEARVLEIVLSQNCSSQKEELCCLLVDKIRHCQDKDEFLPVIHDIASLSGTANSEVSLKARQLLTEYKLPSFKQRRVAIETSLRDALRVSNNDERLAELNHIIKQSESLVDALVPFFSHENSDLRALALEVYCRRSYDAYKIETLSASEEGDLQQIHFEFSLWENEVMTSKPTSPKLSPIRVIESVDNLAEMDKSMLRYGMMCVVQSPEELTNRFSQVVESFRPRWQFFGEEPMNVLNVHFVAPVEGEKRKAMLSSVSELFRAHSERLNSVGMRRITIVSVSEESKFPAYYTFRARLDWNEDKIYRDIEPPLAYHLELRRMRNYDIEFVPTANRQIHLYFAKGKQSKRFFVRAAVRGSNTSLARVEDIVAQVEPVFVEAVRSLETHSVNKCYKGAESHHIFLKIINEVTYAPDRVDGLLRTLGQKYGRRLWKLRVGVLELVGKVRRGNTIHNLRFVVTNPTGHAFEVHGYMEAKDSLSNNHVLVSMGESAPMNGLPVSTPYPELSKIEKKRLKSLTLGTTYCYDFPTLFRIAVESMWAQYEKSTHGVLEGVASRPRELVKFLELELSADESKLVPAVHAVGENDVGMVAWRVTMFTPEYPCGREVIVISNDITFEIGSFGPREDTLFYRASELARELGVPRIYLSANSGARIGLAAEVQRCFQVEWEDENDHEQGFKYLFLSEEDFLQHSSSVIAERSVQPDGSVRYIISTIVGAQHGIGVENLRGSGMIAGETSRAYRDIFTITLATGRSVGIGAYLVRLGQRTVQNSGAPVILTGAVAINKLLGKEVYTSNAQLGGPQIMYKNGVSHIDVSDDMRGVNAIVNWLTYVPRRTGAPLPVLRVPDPIDREVAWKPGSTPYDPRNLIRGVEEDGHWVSGVFDKGSFTETLAGWANTVVCGRARLGGVPVGVICVETRTIETRKPADPANVESQELKSMNAGKVWFPDSAYKTAQAISDFNHGEELPLIIFANWRGFSGGMRDMFEEILKFGAYIVDELRQYKKPVIIYIPPNGELRGGAWVVLDPTINPDMMEMYCDEEGTGGVLEPRGTVEIKYRRPMVVQTIDRLDPLIQRWKQKLAAGCSEQEEAQIKSNIAERQQALIPAYQMVAIGFAELHDTPGRMKEKGAIRDVIRWRTSRSFLYGRLTRRLAEEQLRSKMEAKDASLTRADAFQKMREWFAADGNTDWENDRDVNSWFVGMTAQSEDARLASVRADAIRREVERLYAEDPAAVSEAMKNVKRV